MPDYALDENTRLLAQAMGQAVGEAAADAVEALEQIAPLNTPADYALLFQQAAGVEPDPVPVDLLAMYEAAKQ